LAAEVVGAAQVLATEAVEVAVDIFRLNFQVQPEHQFPMLLVEPAQQMGQLQPRLLILLNAALPQLQMQVQALSRVELGALEVLFLILRQVLVV